MNEKNERTNKKSKKNRQENIWFVYLAQCRDKSLYCGITNNIIKRFQEHNGLRKGGAKYTRGRRPVELLIFRQAKNKSQALKLEEHIKGLPKKDKAAFLENFNGNVFFVKEE